MFTWRDTSCNHKHRTTSIRSNHGILRAHSCPLDCEHRGVHEGSPVPLCSYRAPVSGVTALNIPCVGPSHSHALFHLLLKMIIPSESQTLKSLSCEKKLSCLTSLHIRMFSPFWWETSHLSTRNSAQKKLISGRKTINKGPNETKFQALYLFHGNDLGVATSCSATYRAGQGWGLRLSVFLHHLQIK